VIRPRFALAVVCAALAGMVACACHEPEQPPVPAPPHPTNPTNAGAGVGPEIAEREADASIVPEAGPIPPGDAGIGLFDAAPVGPR
jgi:hypothetical protein